MINTVLDNVNMFAMTRDIVAYLIPPWLEPCSPAQLPRDSQGQAEVIQLDHTWQQLQTWTGAKGLRCVAVHE